MKEQEIWFEGSKTPSQNQLVRFLDIYCDEYFGMYIAHEKMFFIGFADNGDFRFANQILMWTNF